MSSASNEGEQVSPPFGPPDCVWRDMKAGSPVLESAVLGGGNLNGDPVYIGRVYSKNGLFIGTAVPSKGVCLFLNNGAIESSSTYEILTVECGNPLIFQTTELDTRLIFNAGKNDKGETTYVGRHVEGDNTYIGWIQRSTKSLFIPKESEFEVKDGYEVMIHQFLDRLCICPPCPKR